MNIVSERLQFRLLELDDLSNVHELHSFSEVDQYNTLGIPKSIIETERIIADWISCHKLSPIQSYTVCIEEKDSKRFVGLIGLKLSPLKYKRAEVWYKLHPTLWGNGYATEALQRILDFAFVDLKLHRVQAGCAVNNIASIKVLEKVGMIKEGRGRQVLPLSSGWSDNFEYSILETDKRTNT